MHGQESTDDVSARESLEMARTNTPQHLKRAHGTGSIKAMASGRYSARTPGDQRTLGTFDTPEEAQQALDAYIETGAKPQRTKRLVNTEAAQVSRGIGRYLNEVEAGVVNGKLVVNLGAIGNGLPGQTSDPNEVERAIAIVKESAREGSAVQRLKRHQRVFTLTRELEALRAANESNGDAQAFFIEHAKAWAEANGIGYAAFRTMGVPVDVLSEAGITRTFEP